MGWVDSDHAGFSTDMLFGPDSLPLPGISPSVLVNIFGARWIYFPVFVLVSGTGKRAGKINLDW